MTASVTFDETTLFEGFTVTYKISEDISKTIMISDTYRRLDGVLESLNLNNLRSILKNQSFSIKQPLEDICDGSIVKISSSK